jgi:hypothetical protein
MGASPTRSRNRAANAVRDRDTDMPTFLVTYHGGGMPADEEGRVGGYSILRADDMDAAVDLVRDHPFVSRGGSLTVSESVAP